jgi:hypothetical protein
VNNTTDTARNAYVNIQRRGKRACEQRVGVAERPAHAKQLAAKELPARMAFGAEPLHL